MAEGVKEAVLSKLLDSVPVLLILLGVLLFGLGIAKGITYHDWFPIQELPSRVASIVAGIIVFAFGIFLGRKDSLDAPKARRFGIEIQYPKEGDQVHRVDVQGTIRKSPPEKYTLWVFRMYPNSRKYVPLREARVTNEGKTKTWLAEQCDIGGETGDTRYIAAFLVGPSGAALIEYYDDAARVHRTVMKRLKALTDEESEYLPLIKNQTLDMIECRRVRVRRE